MTLEQKPKKQFSILIFLFLIASLVCNSICAQPPTVGYVPTKFEDSVRRVQQDSVNKILKGITVTQPLIDTAYRYLKRYLSFEEYPIQEQWFKLFEQALQAAWLDENRRKVTKK